MPTAIPPTLSEDQIGDLLYLSRIGSTSDLITSIDLFSKTLSTDPPTILAATVDPVSGNGLLHMASANGHTGTASFPIELNHHLNHSPDAIIQKQ